MLDGGVDMFATVANAVLLIANETLSRQAHVVAELVRRLICNREVAGFIPGRAEA